jgi:hypothetical protein
MFEWRQIMYFKKLYKISILCIVLILLLSTSYSAIGYVGNAEKTIENEEYAVRTNEEKKNLKENIDVENSDNNKIFGSISNKDDYKSGLESFKSSFRQQLYEILSRLLDKFPILALIPFFNKLLDWLNSSQDPKDTTPPIKVTGLTVANAKDGKLNLTWNVATDNVAVDYYNIYRNGTLIDTEESTTYQDIGLNNNQEYCYQISAVDTSANEGEKSDERCGMPTSSLIPNSSPEKPVNPLPEHNFVNVSLNPVLSVYVEDADGDNMDVSFKDASDNSIIGTAVNVASETRASVTWHGLSHDTTYSWYAVADDKNGGTNTSDVFSFTTLPEEDTINPSKVTGLTATNAYDGKIDLSWDPASDNVAIAFYKIYRDNTYITQVSTLEYLDSGLNNNQSYSYQVSAVDTSGNEGEKSNPASATPTPGEDNATILPESGHIMIMGNGYLQINTTLNINGTLVTLNGTVYLDKTVLHIWWNLTTGFFKINISSFNSDTTAETKLIDFFLEIKDPTVNPEDKITFYFNFVSMKGESCITLETQAKKGSIDFNGNIKIGSISGQISINNLKNVTLQGSFYADNYKEIQGEAYIEWDFTEDTPSVLLYGNLTRDAVRYLNIEDLLFEIQDIFCLSIQKINFSGNGHIEIGEDIIIDSELESLVIQNLHLEAYGKNVSLSGDLNLISSAEIYIKTDPTLKILELALSLSGSLILTNFYLNLNNELVISCNYAELSGYGSLIIGDDIILDATITKFDVSNLQVYVSSKEMTISGTLNLNAAAKIYIKTDPAFKTLEFAAYGGGTISITNFYVSLNNGQLIVSGGLLYIDIPSIGGSFTSGGNLGIGGTISSATLTSCYVSVDGKNFTFTGVFNVNAGGSFYISTNLNNYLELTLSGGLGLTISNMILEVGNTFKFEAEAIGLTLGASGSVTAKIQDKKLHLSGGGSAGFSFFITAGHVYWYKSNGNTVYITAHIPSLSLSVGASVDYIEIPIGGKENDDNGGGGGDDDDDKIKEITVQGDIILDGNLNLQADFTLQNKFKINVNVNGYAFVEVKNFYWKVKEDNVQKFLISMNYAKISGNLGPNGHIIISDYIELYGTGSGTRTVDIDFLTFAFVNYSGNVDYIDFVGNTGPTINFYLGEGKISLQGTSGSGTHTLIVQNMYISGPNKTISVASITAYLKNSFYFGNYIELSVDGSLTINNFNSIDAEDGSMLLSIGSLSLTGDGYFYVNNNIKVNGALSLTIQNLNTPDKVSVEYFSLTFSGSFSGEITASEGNIKITNGGSSVNIPSLTVTNLCGPQGRCLSFGGALTLTSSNGILEITKQSDGSRKIQYSGSATLTLNNIYVNSINIDQIVLAKASGSVSLTCNLIIHDDGSVEIAGSGTDLHLENLRWSGKIKRVDVDLEGSVTFMFNKNTKITSLSATLSCDINVEMDGWIVDKIKCSSINIDGSIIIDSSNSNLKPIIIIDCNSLSVISEIEIYKTLVEKIKLTTLTVSNTLVTINASDDSFSFDGDIHIASMIYRDNIGIDRITVTNIDVNGDIYVKKLDGDKHFFIESNNGFSFTSSLSTIKIWELEFTLDFEIQGDLEVWLREIPPEYNTHRIDIYIDNNVDLDLGIIVQNYEVYLDADINNGGHLSIDWRLEGDCDGFIVIDSSYLSGNIDLEAYYNGYGIKSLTFDYIDANGFIVQWDPFNFLGTLIPVNWDITGSLNVGSADINFNDGNGWIDIYPEAIQSPIADAGGPYSANTGQTITLDASDSFDPQDDALQYRWDFDYKGPLDILWDTDWLNSPTVDHIYNTAGNYDIKLLIRERYTTLHLSDVSYTSISISTLLPGIIQGYVYDKQTNNPLANAHVFTDVGSYSCYTDSSGYYSFEVLTGTYSYYVQATKTQYEPQIKGPITVGSSETKTVNFYLNQSSNLYGYVKDQFNQTVGGAKVEILGTPYSTTTIALGTSKGLYTFNNGEVQPGNTYQIKASKEGYTSQTLTEPIVQGPNQLDFVIQKPLVKPTVTTKDPSYDDYWALLKGNLDNMGGEPNCEVWFEYKKNSSSSYTPTTHVTKTTTGYFEWLVNGLTASTAYQFRACASNSAGTSYGSVKYFTTTACFLAGTKITMADGSYKNIEDVVIGDFVKAYDEEADLVKNAEVVKVFNHAKEQSNYYYLLVNGKIRVTPNHPMYINDNWITAGNIKIGDMLQSIKGIKIPVLSVEKIYEKEPTFNIEVKDLHTYYAEDILVHNKDVPNPKWVRATSGSGTEWSDIPKAYDTSTSTYAYSKELGVTQGWQYGNMLYLNRPTIKCSKIRLNALYHVDYIDKVTISVYYNGGYHQVHNGAFPNHAYMEVSLGGTYQVSGVALQFHYKGCLSGTTCDVYDFQFWDTIG